MASKNKTKRIHTYTYETAKQDSLLFVESGLVDRDSHE